jgi:hypothetical protein
MVGVGVELEVAVGLGVNVSVGVGVSVARNGRFDTPHEILSDANNITTTTSMRKLWFLNMISS